MKQLVVRKESLQKLIGQFKLGYLVIVAGRPSTGKTSFILDLLADTIRRQSSSLLYALEISKELVAGRLSGIIAPAEINAIFKDEYSCQGGLSKSDAILQSLKLHVNDSPALSVNKVATEILALNRTRQVGS